MIDGSELWPASVSAGEVVYPPGGTLGPRWQRDVQLVLIHEGTMTVTIDGRPRPTQRAGTVGLLLPGHREAFAFATDTSTRHSWMQARVPNLPAQLADRLAQLPPAMPTSTALAELARAAVELGTAAPRPTSRAADLRAAPTTPIEGLVRALFTAALWRYVTEAETPVSGSQGLVEHAREHIRARAHDPALDLAALARACHVSPGHLARAFKREVGVGPIAYLWQRRVAVGVDLLANTGLPVAAIAERCGFKTVYHFSRRVKQATGRSPTELRRRRWAAAGHAVPSQPEIFSYEKV
jgi:AraC family transcriptional regulator